MGNLQPHYMEYLRQRTARGEISRQTAVDFAYPLAAFDRCFGERPITQLGRAAIDRWLETIGTQAPATRRHRLSVVRGFCRWMVANGRIPTDPTRHVAHIRQPRHVPVTLRSGEIERLLTSVAHDSRALAVTHLMVSCGARCVEVSRLAVADYDPDALTVVFVGKGGHQRIVPVPPAAARAIDRYLDEVGRTGGPLIRSRYELHSPLTARTLSAYMRRWMLAAGVKASPLDGRSAHGLRRTAGSDVMDFVRDIRVVQEMLGHARIETTAKAYLRPVPIERLREAMGGRGYAA